MPKPKRNSAPAKRRTSKATKPKKARAAISAPKKSRTPARKKTAKPQGEFVPSINYAALSDAQFGTTLLAEFASGYRVLAAPFDENDISIATEKDAAKAGNAMAAGLGRFGKMNIELQSLITPPLGMAGMFLQVVATLAPDRRRLDVTRGPAGKVSHEVHDTPIDQLTYIVLKGPDIQRIRILDGAGLIIQKIGVRCA